MANIKHPKNPNKRGMINVAIGELIAEVRQVAKEENRSMNRQVAVIIREWLEAHKTQTRAA